MDFEMTMTWAHNLAMHVTGALFVLCICYAMVSDATRLRISNSISVALIALFGVYAALRLPAGAIAIHAGLALSVFLIGFLFFALRWVGGGDVKLMAAVMLWMGPENGSAFVFWTGLFGGAMAVSLLALKNSLYARILLANCSPFTRVVSLAERGVCPYGLAIGASALVCYPRLFFI